MIRIENDSIIAEYYESGNNMTGIQAYLRDVHKAYENQKFGFFDSEGKKVMLIKYKAAGCREVNIPEVMGISLQEDYEQQFAIDDLRDNDIQLVTLTGHAGTGKTFISLCGALDAGLNVIYTREHIDVGKGIGYLPGSEEMKFAPYLRGLYDNIDEIKRLSSKNFKGKVEARPVYGFRGASLRDTLLIVDESQNCDVDTLKMLVSRIGRNSKIVLCGSFNQIDNKRLTQKTNGLYMVIRAFKGQHLFGANHLTKDKRSKLSQLCDALLNENTKECDDLLNDLGLI